MYSSYGLSVSLFNELMIEDSVGLIVIDVRRNMAGKGGSFASMALLELHCWI